MGELISKKDLYDKIVKLELSALEQMKTLAKLENTGMRLVIDISEYDKEWISNAYGIPQDINTKIAEAIINAEPIQPKRGKWNRLDMDTFNCNQCGTTFVLNQGSEKMYFCPNCGAKMEVTT